MPTTPDEALTLIPKKGSIDFPCEAEKGWLVDEDLDAWGKEQGYLSAVVFKRTKGRGRNTKWQYKLVVVGKCPWGSGHLRWYTAPIVRAA